MAANENAVQLRMCGKKLANRKLLFTTSINNRVKACTDNDADESEGNLLSVLLLSAAAAIR